MLAQMVRSTDSPSMQERAERSRAGRLLISVVLTVLLATIIVINAQPSKLREHALDTAGPVLNAVGLDQGWGVFAPDPRNISLEFFARVRYADGTRETWRLPEGGAVVGEYWDYRWRKYLEYLVQDPWAVETRTPMSRYIARTLNAGGREPEQIVLVRRTQRIRPPGSDPPRGPVAEEAYHIETIRPEDLR